MHTYIHEINYVTTNYNPCQLMMVVLLGVQGLHSFSVLIAKSFNYCLNLGAILTYIIQFEL